MGKVCSHCKQFKPDSEYHINGDKLRAQCKPCRLLSMKVSKYNLPDDWIMETFEEQDGLCAICGEEDPFPVIDHDHSCCPGSWSCGLCVRALICRDCNLGLGHFHDDPERLTRAIEYLAEHQPWEGS